MDNWLRSDALRGILHGFSKKLPPDTVPVLGERPVFRVRQVHSAHVVIAEEASDELEEGDAIVTSQAGFAIGIVTADCAPVLLADKDAGIVAAAHAGWRGAVAGVCRNTVEAMVETGADRRRIVAVIGPCIAPANYEVDGPFRDRFGDGDARFFAPSPDPERSRSGHVQFDLPAFVAAQLADAGVMTVRDLALDTYAQPDRFHSYRRATHDGSDRAGRQWSVIAAG
ncbi:MAG: peptidoglycan editing factor PgeF [Pontixanthobacter sp.]